jgi:hypothetical protein
MLGIDFDPSSFLEFADGWGYNRDAAVRLDHMIEVFRGRLEELAKAITCWKPSGFWQMQYQGYGSVLAIEWWGFWFTLFIGLVTVTSLVIQAASVNKGK